MSDVQEFVSSNDLAVWDLFNVYTAVIGELEKLLNFS